MVTSLHFTFYFLNQTREVTFNTSIEYYDIIARFIIYLTQSENSTEDFFFIYFWHLSLIFSASVRPILFLLFIAPIFDEMLPWYL